MDLMSVCYTSRAARVMTADDIDRLLIDAREKNAANGITGLLLYGDGHFFQCFEGSRYNVEKTYARIRQSRLHQALVELEYHPIPERVFRKWFMGFRELPGSKLQELVHHQWSKERPWIEERTNHSSAMQQLLTFANR